MATLVNQEDVQRAEGTGFEGPGPAVDLPSMGGMEQPTDELVVTVRPQKPSTLGNNNWSKIQKALSEGYSREEISAYMQKELNVPADEADMQVIDSVSEKIKQATSQGYSLDEVKNFLIENRYDGRVIDSALALQQKPKTWKKFEWDPNTPAEEAQDIADLYSSVYGKYSTMGKQVGGFFNEDMGIEARREVNQLNASIAKKLQDQGLNAYINPANGEVMLQDENGQETEVDSSILNGLYNSKSEIGGAISGAIAGAKLGNKAPLRARPYTVPAGTILGSMAGASIGKAADLTINAAILKEDLENSLYMTQMKEAAIFDGVAGVVGAGIWRLGAAGGKSIMRAYDFALAGNTDGAYKALLDNMQISEDQAKEIVQNWEKLNGTPAGKNFKEQAINVIARTQKGTEGYVQYAATSDPKLAQSMISNIDERAKGLYKAIDTVSDDNVGNFVRQDLKAYKDDVKEFYGLVKNQGVDAINGTDFRFDLEKTAVEPVMKNISAKISNPAMRDRFLNYAARIDSATQVRTFEGLVDLRQAVNEFKYSKTGLNNDDIVALNSVLNKIDGQIAKAVKEYMPENGKEWLTNFSKAKEEYSKMKLLERNVLYRYVTKKGVTEAGIQKALSKYATNKDVDSETFNALVDTLSPAVRAKVEGAAIKNLTSKYTLGEEVDFQAVHFPALANHLKELNITTPEGKALASVIDDMAKVFKNDVNLSKISGNIAVPRFQSYLTTDPVVRVKYEVASHVFNAIKRYAPGKQANNLALLNKVQKLLEDPLHSKTADQLIKAMPKESQEEMRSLVKQLQVEAAKNPAKRQDFVNMYKQSANGKFTVTNGALGKGVYLVDKIKNPSPSAKIIKREVNMSRMATLEDIGSVIGREVSEKDLRNVPDLQQKLVDAGYLGIRVEGKAMLFPETTVGTKTVKSMPAKVEERIVSRYAPIKETASTINPNRTDFNYVTSNEEILGAYSGSGAIRNDFVAPKNAKILDLSDTDVANKVFKELFGGRMPPGETNLETLMHDLHEGALNARQPGWTAKLKKYMKDNGYSAQSFNGEEAWLPGILKDTKPVKQ